MISKVKSLTLQGQTTKNELLCVLREDTRKFSLPDIVRCSLQIQQEAECIHTSYKKEYIKAETGFLIRIREVKDDNFHYTGQVDVEELNTAIGILEEQEKNGKRHGRDRSGHSRDIFNHILIHYFRQG